MLPVLIVEEYDIIHVNSNKVEFLSYVFIYNILIIQIGIITCQ